MSDFINRLKESALGKVVRASYDEAFPKGWNNHLAGTEEAGSEDSRSISNGNWMNPGRNLMRHLDEACKEFACLNFRDELREEKNETLL